MTPKTALQAADTLKSPADVLTDLWGLAQLDESALSYLKHTGSEPTLPSSFRVAAVAQATVSAAALAAAEVRYARGLNRQEISVDMRHAAQECTNYLSIDGVIPDVWDKLSGIYPCGKDGEKGWVRIHANFKHHRDGTLRLLGCPTDESTDRTHVVQALQTWHAKEFELAADKAGLVVAAVRSFEEWDAHPQAIAISELPLFTIEKIGEAPPMELPALDQRSRPLDAVHILDLTRVLAGPVGGRTLAAYGADVMLVNSPNLPNIDAIAETSRGKLSTHLDLNTEPDRLSLKRLVEGSHIFIQGYRPGGLAHFGFSPEQVADLRPGIVYVSLSAYGHMGPWAAKRGFDSLVQTATGFNVAEGQAAESIQPKALPAQIIDHASGYLMALGAQAALIRQLREGGSWHVQVSLAQTANWIRSLGRLPNGLLTPKPALDDLLEQSDSGFGKLVAVRHSAQFSETPAYWSRPSVPPGTNPPKWP